MDNASPENISFDKNGSEITQSDSAVNNNPAPHKNSISYLFEDEGDPMQSGYGLGIPATYERAGYSF